MPRPGDSDADAAGRTIPDAVRMPEDVPMPLPTIPSIELYREGPKRPIQRAAWASPG